MCAVGKDLWIKDFTYSWYETATLPDRRGQAINEIPISLPQKYFVWTLELRLDDSWQPSWNRHLRECHTPIKSACFKRASAVPCSKNSPAFWGQQLFQLFHRMLYNNVHFTASLQAFTANRSIIVAIHGWMDGILRSWSNTRIILLIAAAGLLGSHDLAVSFYSDFSRTLMSVKPHVKYNKGRWRKIVWRYDAQLQNLFFLFFLHEQNRPLHITLSSWAKTCLLIIYQWCQGK